MVKSSIIALAGLLLTGVLVAQEPLIVEKDIAIEPTENVAQKVDQLVEWLVDNTNGQIQFRNCQSNKITIEGDMPLLLEKSPFALSSQFNGNIAYRLDIAVTADQINLHFHDLYHHSQYSINGWDFDMGLLQTDFKASKQPVLSNFDYLSEDYARVDRFKSDEQMAQLVCKRTLETIDQTINQIQ